MSESEGVVIGLEGEFAIVQAQAPASACGSCSSRGNCGTTLAGPRGATMLRLPNTIQARPGDHVILRAADGLLLRAVWRAYGIPLFCALAGAMIAATVAGNEKIAPIGMLLGLGLGFGWMKYRGLDSARREPMLTLAFKYPSRDFRKDSSSC